MRNDALRQGGNKMCRTAFTFAHFLGWVLSPEALLKNLVDLADGRSQS